MTEKTRVPLSWIFVLISTFSTLAVVGIPSIIWVLSIKTDAQAATQVATQKAEGADEKAREATEYYKSVLNYMQIMDRRLSRIEGSLKISE